MAWPDLGKCILGRIYPCTFETSGTVTVHSQLDPFPCQWRCVLWPVLPVKSVSEISVMAVWTPGLRTPVFVPSSCTVAWHGLSYPVIRFSPGLRQPSSLITHAAPSVFGSLLSAASVLSQLLTFSGQCYCIRSIIAPGVFCSKLLHPICHSSWCFLVIGTSSVLSQLLTFSVPYYCIPSVH